jgi:hypothetical protein
MAAFTRRILRFRQQPGLAWLQPFLGGAAPAHDAPQPNEDEVPDGVNHYFQVSSSLRIAACF